MPGILGGRLVGQGLAAWIATPLARLAMTGGLSTRLEMTQVWGLCGSR